MLNYARTTVLGLALISCSLSAMRDATKIITEGSEEEIIQLLKEGHDCNSKVCVFNSIYPLICIATRRGQLAVIRYLHSRGININTTIADGWLKGWAPMHLAVHHGNIEAIQCLHSLGADINLPITAGADMGKTPMHLATWRGHIEIIKYLKSQGVDINFPIVDGPYQGFAPIHIATMEGRYEVIKYLITQNVDLNTSIAAGEYAGMTPIHIQSWFGEVEVIKFLQSIGANINTPIAAGLRQGYAPIHVAAWYGQVKVIKYLQSQGVDINMPIAVGPDQGKTPMQLATEQKKVNIIEYLQTQGIARFTATSKSRSSSTLKSSKLFGDKQALRLWLLDRIQLHCSLHAGNDGYTKRAALDDACTKMVTLVDGDHHVYCNNPANGDRLWQQPAAEEQSPIKSPSSVAFNSSGNRVVVTYQDRTYGASNF